MLVVLEGTDSVGKSTFAEELSAVLGARVQHTKAPMPDSYYLRHLLESLERPVILDRSWFSTAVYDAMLDRASPYSPVEAHIHSLFFPVHRFLLTRDPDEIRLKDDDIPVLPAYSQSVFRVLAPRYGFAELDITDLDSAIEVVSEVVSTTTWDGVVAGFPGGAPLTCVSLMDAYQLVRAAPYAASAACYRLGDKNEALPDTLWMYRENGLASSLRRVRHEVHQA